MSGRDIRRSYYLKELLERQTQKLGSKELAESLLDTRLGPEWREQINHDDIGIADVSSRGVPEPADKESFYDRVRKTGDEVDMGWMHAEYDDEADSNPNPETDVGPKKSIRGLLEELLEKLNS